MENIKVRNNNIVATANGPESRTGSLSDSAAFAVTAVGLGAWAIDIISSIRNFTINKENVWKIITDGKSTEGMAFMLTGLCITSGYFAVREASRYAKDTMAKTLTLGIKE